MTCFCRVLQPGFLLVCPHQATIAKFLQTVKLVFLHGLWDLFLWVGRGPGYLIFRLMFYHKSSLILGLSNSWTSLSFAGSFYFTLHCAYGSKSSAYQSPLLCPLSFVNNKKELAFPNSYSFFYLFYSSFIGVVGIIICEAHRLQT